MVALVFQEDEWAVEVDHRRRRSSTPPPRSPCFSPRVDQPVAEEAPSTKEVKHKTNLLSPLHFKGMRRGSAPLGEEVAASLAGGQQEVVGGAMHSSDVAEGKAGEEKRTPVVGGEGEDKGSVGGGEGEGTEGARTKSSSEVTSMGEAAIPRSEQPTVVGGEGEGSEAAQPKSATHVTVVEEGAGPEEQGSVEGRDGPRGKSSSEVGMVGERQPSLDLSTQEEQGEGQGATLTAQGGHEGEQSLGPVMSMEVTGHVSGSQVDVSDKPDMAAEAVKTEEKPRTVSGQMPLSVYE